MGENNADLMNIVILKKKLYEITSFSQVYNFMNLCAHMLPERVNSLYKLLKLIYDYTPKRTYDTNGDVIETDLNKVKDIIANIISLAYVEFEDIINHPNEELLSTFKGRSNTRVEYLKYIMEYLESCTQYEDLRNRVINIYKEIDNDKDLKLFTIAKFLL